MGTNDVLEAALARESEKLRALQDVGAALGSTLDLNELLEVILEQVSKLVNADRSTLYLFDEETGQLWSKIAQGKEGDVIRLQVGEGLAGWVAKTLQPLNIADVYEDPRFDRSWDAKSGYRTRSVLCVPLKNQHGRLIGVLQVLNKRALNKSALDPSGTPEETIARFSGDDEELLQTLAAQAAISIENSRLFHAMVRKNMELLETKEALERKIRELDVLFEVALVAGSAEALDELLEGLLARSMWAFDAEAAGLLLFRGKLSSGELRIRVGQGNRPVLVQRHMCQKDEGVGAWVADRQTAQVVDDVQSDARHLPAWNTCFGFEPKSLLSIPLRWDGGSGALELWNKAGGSLPFSTADQKLATLIAGHVSSAIEREARRGRREQQERLSTIGQFLSSILHDLKTPMTVIHGYVQLLRDEPDAAKRKEAAALIRRQVEHVNAMTRETLAFARGDRRLLIRKVYLRQFFLDLVEQLRREFGEQAMEIDLRLNYSGVAHFDPHKVQRAVHNLARNAYEALQDESQQGAQGSPGKFTMEVAQPENDALELRFSDDGPGIPEALAPELFEPFRTHNKQGGTGLGLAVVHRIVRDHGGRIDLVSKPGATTFTVRLPQPPDTASGKSSAGGDASSRASR